jgi:hypothetical protein
MNGMTFSFDMETEPGVDVIELFDADGASAGEMVFASQAEVDAAEALLCADIGGSA